jgi:hypothetical protein
MFILVFNITKFWSDLNFKSGNAGPIPLIMVYFEYVVRSNIIIIDKI